MPDYIAFLRAINLGATRKFAKADVIAATEAAGMTDVQTHLNTGNVRLTSTRRSSAAVRRDLERAYETDRGFAVPTVVFTPEEVRAITARGEELRPENVDGARHYIQLLHEPPGQDAIDAVHALSAPGEQIIVEGRAAYALIGSVHDSRLLRTKEYVSLGEGTSRTISVLKAIVEKWC
ncbi:MAG TPA: DUF1697 domain-containing protein [Intrasporangiaceae bacterium]|nr:DUF1697 domain-containing protein [Intrasporangiaceae bacterium]